MSVASRTTKPQFVRPSENIKLPNSSKITKQQLPKLPKLNHQCNRGIPSHYNNISKAPMTIKPFNDVSICTPQIQVPIHNALNSNNLKSQMSNSTYTKYTNTNTNLYNNHQATAMDLTKTTTLIILSMPEVTPVD